MWTLAWDGEYGGILSCLSYGEEQPQASGYLEASGIAWDDKRLHDWTQRHFYDSEYGEWYQILQRDGTPQLRGKGDRVSAVSYVPRALLNVYESFTRSLPR